MAAPFLQSILKATLLCNASQCIRFGLCALHLGLVQLAISIRRQNGHGSSHAARKFATTLKNLVFITLGLEVIAEELDSSIHVKILARENV